MRIEELILEGFKSYPVRTSISGWDSSFNAITGLNGSGKSNILDAICFVLGLTNLQTVRAANLQDLIYKRGQAGITKASVTIVFDNSDKTKAPVGYESLTSISVTRQIAMGGLSKYLINGHKVPLQSVHSLFQSVQLNINNPNFVIMQGKITKVLNMKPAEILGLIEEAAGTRMYEERKEKAARTMEKKQRKVSEIESQLSEEIIPRLDKLRTEKSAFLSFQKASAELERLDRLVVAHEHVAHARRTQELERAAQDKRENARALERDVEGWRGRLREAEEQEREVRKKQEKELAKGGKLAGYEQAVKELETEVVKTRAQADIRRENIAEEARRIEGLEKGVEGLRAAREDKATATALLSSDFASIHTSYQSTVTALSRSEELLQTLLTGLSSSSASATTGAGGFLGQLQEAQARAAAGASAGQQARVRRTHLERELKERKGRVGKVREEGEGVVRELEGVRGEVRRLEEGLGGVGWDEEVGRSAGERQREEGERVRELVERHDALKSRLAALDFVYSDPSPNFDRAKVKGLVVNLIELAPENAKYATALEVAAGGRLYNVVTEDEKVSSALLEHGRLRKRVTFIPLNKIRPSKLAPAKLAAAQKLAPGKVRDALSLVGSDPSVRAAMEYVFGECLICDDAETASKVTFDPRIRTRSVTLSGDVYDPSGTLSGGSAPSGGGVLVKAQEVRAVERELRDAQAKLKEVRRELDGHKKAEAEWRRIRRELDLKLHQVGLLEEQVGASNATRIIAEIEELKKSLLEVDEATRAAQAQEEKAKADVVQLEREMDEFKNNRGAKLEELKRDIARMRKDVARQTASVKSGQKEVQTAELELEQMVKDIEAAVAEVEEAKEALEASRAELEAFLGEIAEKQKSLDQAEAKLNKERAQLDTFAEELSALEDAISTHRSQIKNAETDLKAVEHDVAEALKQAKAHANARVALENQYSWIEEEKEFFGQPDTPYDFTGINIKQASKQRAELADQQKSKKNKINAKVMTMIDTVEKREQALKKMMSTVLGDKEKIEDTIAELDRYKRDALHKTWEKVNKDFGEIFAELLPGNFAKLEPSEGKDLTEGLEVKVRLGSVWKASLTELSGGQRSLIALSLIMSLLQFRPAPMYILDEIDAALDLSHTQHIGHLFRNRFSGSQFIVVSLKEGLFTNANVLFRARFRDGTSLVERTETRSMQNSHRSALDKSNATAGSSRAGSSRAGARRPAAAAAA